MSVIFILLFFSISVAVIFLIAFLWSVKSGQYEDGYTPSVRMLFEDKPEGKSDSVGALDKTDKKEESETKTQQ